MSLVSTASAANALATVENRKILSEKLAGDNLSAIADVTAALS